MAADPKDGLTAEQRLKRFNLSFSKQERPDQTNYALYVKTELRQKLTYDDVPSTQDEVDQIPVERRGLSFFTSMPAPDDILVSVTLPIGNAMHMVHVTPDELEVIRAGGLPLVRCFSIHGKIRPWYQIGDYNPYVHYFAAKNDGWAWLGSGVVMCWQPLDQIDGDIDGYIAVQCSALKGSDIRSQLASRLSRRPPWEAPVEVEEAQKESVPPSLVAYVNRPDGSETGFELVSDDDTESEPDYEPEPEAEASPVVVRPRVPRRRPQPARRKMK